MRSITFKLVLAFLGIGVVSIVLIVFLVRWNTGTEFSRFVLDRRGAELIEELEDYYRTNGSWKGVEVTFPIGNSQSKKGSGPSHGPSFILVDENGDVISARPGQRRSERIRQPDIDEGIPIEIDGEYVGTLIGGRTPFERNPREQEFIERTTSMLVYSALGAFVVALLLGLFLSRTLTRPIRELTEATRSVADGNLGMQVSVRSQDEMGELAKSFNKMSTDLANSTAARKQMAADIAHELRTPLSLILGHADGVHDGVLAPTKENFEIIREEAIRLEHLVDDLRILSLADAGELSINLQPVSPDNLMNDVQASYQHLATQKNIRLVTNAPQGLPVVDIDPIRMTQVLTNVLDNAFQHTPEGGQISLSANSAQGTLELSIKDSGPGLQEGQVKRIFNRFYRTDNSRNRDAGGSGLGLAIAKSIVQAHNGQILAESAPGQGLKITIRIPI
ncbi:MAG: ATP-binding protein [Anaerolineae bacterium]|nr:ATP-binding protein [Anaerolineae bacterium]